MAHIPARPPWLSWSLTQALRKQSRLLSVQQPPSISLSLSRNYFHQEPVNCVLLLVGPVGFGPK